MNVSIRRLGRETLPDLRPEDLSPLIDDFQKRADPHGVDGWKTEDIAAIALRTSAPSSIDATWFAFDGERPIGFAILVFGFSMQQGKTEGQILALYVRPGTPLSVAPRLMEAMKDYARGVGAFRIIGCTQRDVKAAFGRLGGVPVATIYQISLDPDPVSVKSVKRETSSIKVGRGVLSASERHAGLRANVSAVSPQIHEGMAEESPAKRGSAPEDERSILRERLPATTQAHSAAMRR